MHPLALLVSMSEPEARLPWMEEPLPIEDAVEALAQTSEEDAEEVEHLEERIADLEARLAALEDGTGVECPSCEDGEVLKSGVGAAKLVREGSLSESNVEALNQESHVCLDCGESFTPKP